MSDIWYMPLHYLFICTQYKVILVKIVFYTRKKQVLRKISK